MGKFWQGNFWQALQIKVISEEKLAIMTKSISMPNTIFSISVNIDDDNVGEQLL